MISCAPAACLVVLCAAIAPVIAQVPRDQHEAHRLHQDPKAYIAALEDPQRDAYQKPHEVLQALAIKPGEIVADNFLVFETVR
jgi:predicted methyltransferase